MELSNPELEAKILATVMTHPKFAPVPMFLLGKLWLTAFTVTAHREIAGVIRQLVDARLLPDSYAVENKLLSAGRAELVPDVSRVMVFAETTEVLESRTRMLFELTSHRISFNDFQKANELLKEGKLDDFAKHKNRIRDNMTGLSVAGFGLSVGIREASEKFVEKLLERIKSPGLTGVPTGFTTFDLATLGLQFKVINLLAARPSHGKTALGIQVALNAGRRGYPVLFFSHEMNAGQIMARACANLSSVNLSGINSGRINDESVKRCVTVREALAALPIEIIDHPSLSPSLYCDLLRYHARKHNKQGLVIVDYIQKESIPSFKGQRPEEIAEISKLWHLALQETEWASLFMAQLNRNSAKKPPELADLKGSGALEQDAHLVAMLYRPGHDDSSKFANVADLSVPKNRDGRLTYQKLHFTGYSQRFEEWDSGRHTERNRDEMYEKENEAVASQIKKEDEHEQEKS